MEKNGSLPLLPALGTLFSPCCVTVPKLDVKFWLYLFIFYFAMFGCCFLLEACYFLMRDREVIGLAETLKAKDPHNLRCGIGDINHQMTGDKLTTQ